MKNYRLITILFLIIFTGGACFNLLRESYTKKQDIKKEQAAVLTVLPQGTEFVKSSEKVSHYKVYKTSSRTANDIVGLAFLTTDLAPEIRGYAGPIKIMAGMDLNGVITKAHVISHSETPSYVVELDTFLNQFNGKGIRDVFQSGKDIDGITRATITSEAVSRSIEKGLKVTAKEVLGLDPAGIAREDRPFPVGQMIIPLALFIVAIAGILRHNTLIRWTALTGGFLYFGIIKSTMVSVVQAANLSLFKLPAFAQSPLWYALVGLTLATTLVWGMAYCGSLCPFASVQEALYDILHKSKKGFRKKPGISPELDRKGRYLKYIVLCSALLASILLGNASAASIEPFLTLFARKGTTLAWSLVGLTLIAGMFHFRFWCKYLCPAGACLGLIARVSPFKIKPGKGCTHCDICDKICPTGAIHMDARNLPVIDYPECVLCGKCVQKCPKQTLTMRGFSHREQ